MKVLLVSLLLVAGAFARSTVQQQETHAEGPECPLEDPLEREGPLPLNVTLHDILNIELGSEITNLKVEGLSTLHYKVDINAILLTATFDVTIAKVSGTATYKADGYIDARPFSQGTIPSGNFTGSGAGAVSATNVKLHGSASLWVNVIGNKVTITILNLSTISFDSISVDLGSDFIIAGSPVDWAALSAGLKANFDREFAANKQEIQRRIRLAANRIVEKYTLAELIDLIGDGGDDGGEPGC